VLLEAASIEFERGNYENAVRRLAQAQLVDADHFHAFLSRAAAFAMGGNSAEAESHLVRARAASIALAYHGQVRRADWLIEKIEAIYGRLRRFYELANRQRSSPSDANVVAELRELQTDPIPRFDKAPSDLGDTSPETPLSGTELYALHCSACHGAGGAGDGPASRHLYPRPRDFRSEPFRLVSSRNGVPTPSDLTAVIRRGIPGTSMPAFDALPDSAWMLLAEEVMKLHRRGWQDRLAASRSDGGPGVAADQELTQLVRQQTTPADAISPPATPAADAQSIARGKEFYEQLGCRHCHEPAPGGGRTGWMFDSQGRVTPPRNLALDPFKGGAEPSSVFLRIRLGMPGTVHPACTSLSDDDVLQLVHYCRSLSREPKGNWTNHQRYWAAQGLPSAVGR
jgi:mono/diheme cytochrome c family protein